MGRASYGLGLGHATMSAWEELERQKYMALAQQQTMANVGQRPISYPNDVGAASVQPVEPKQNPLLLLEDEE